VIVETSFLLVRPADQPDVQVEVTVQLDEVPLALVVAYEWPPEGVVVGYSEHEPVQLGSIEIPAGR
jgi:hypothetical protein